MISFLSSSSFASLLLLLTVSVSLVGGFTPQTSCTSNRIYFQQQQQSTATRTLQLARGFADDFDDEDDDDAEDDRELVYARRSGRRGREEGAYYDEDSSSSGSRRYQDNVEFFDLDDDDDDMFEEDFDRKKNSDLYEETYNGIIPNPLLDAMDPDGVYERLGPELFKDWTFWRDMILFTAFLAFFTRDTHHYGTFDSVVEGMERLPATFIR
jgi:hypothetical protein